MIPSRFSRAVPLLIALIAASPATAGTWEAIEQLPGQTPVELRVEGKPRNYFRITREQPLVVSIDGPARLRLTSRADLSGRKGSSAEYALRAMEGDRELERQKTETSRSAQVRGPAKGDKLGKSRRMVVEVPGGHHEIRLALEGLDAVFVRLHLAAPLRGNGPVVTLAPVDAARSVTMVEGQKAIPYHSIRVGKPVRFQLVGPTMLEMVTRLDFDSSMRGSHTYRLAIDEGSRRVREIEFRTTRSNTASYSNLKDRIPSKFDLLRVPFDQGRHEISVVLLAPVEGVAEIHARIPQPMVGDKE